MERRPLQVWSTFVVLTSLSCSFCLFVYIYGLSLHIWSFARLPWLLIPSDDQKDVLLSGRVVFPVCTAILFLFRLAFVNLRRFHTCSCFHQLRRLSCVACVMPNTGVNLIFLSTCPLKMLNWFAVFSQFQLNQPLCSALPHRKWQPKSEKLWKTETRVEKFTK